jgi:hypothetical protein
LGYNPAPAIQAAQLATDTAVVTQDLNYVLVGATHIASQFGVTPMAMGGNALPNTIYDSGGAAHTNAGLGGFLDKNGTATLNTTGGLLDASGNKYATGFLDGSGYQTTSQVEAAISATGIGAGLDTASTTCTVNLSASTSATFSLTTWEDYRNTALTAVEVMTGVGMVENRGVSFTAAGSGTVTIVGGGGGGMGLGI